MFLIDSASQDAGATTASSKKKGGAGAVMSSADGSGSGQAASKGAPAFDAFAFLSMTQVVMG